MSSGKWRPSCLGLNVLRERPVLQLHFLYNASNHTVHVNSLRLSDTYVSLNKAITGSDNGLLPDQHQAIIQTSVGLLLIGILGKI